MLSKIHDNNAEFKEKDINSILGFQNIKQPNNDLKSIELLGLILAINYFEKIQS